MNKRVSFTVLSLTVVLIASFLLHLGCANVKHLEAPRFLEQAKQIGEINTVQYTELIGVTSDRVYLEHWSAPVLFGPGITVYWTRFSDLPPGLASELKAGTNPWKNKD